MNHVLQKYTIMITNAFWNSFLILIQSSLQSPSSTPGESLRTPLQYEYEPQTNYCILRKRYRSRTNFWSSRTHVKSVLLKIFIRATWKPEIFHYYTPANFIMFGVFKSRETTPSVSPVVSFSLCVAPQLSCFTHCGVSPTESFPPLFPFLHYTVYSPICDVPRLLSRFPRFGAPPLCYPHVSPCESIPHQFAMLSPACENVPSLCRLPQPDNLSGRYDILGKMGGE